MTGKTKTGGGHGAKTWVRCVAAVVVCIVLAVVLCVIILPIKIQEVDTVDINRVVTELNTNGTATRQKYDFVAVSADGSVVFSTLKTVDETLAQRLNRAIKQRDTVADFAGGKVIFYTHTNAAIDGAKTAAASIAVASILIGLLFVVAVIWYDEVRVLRPFKKLKAFSAEVANGNFDLPLKMDKGESFGAFTEAFDLLRHKLQQAKEAEKQALQAKRQLLAELSHDLKTPLATILATAELMEARGAAGAEKIVAKTKQIDKLLSDIYRNSIADVGRLTVELTKTDMQTVLDILHAADGACNTLYQNAPPGGSVMLDRLRFEECVDNVFGNAIKYAEGDVKVKFGIQNNYVWISFVDKGDGIAEEELCFVTDKFFRGSRAKAVSGAGLGLHVSKTLLEKMGGFMTVDNAQEAQDGYGGLCITFYLSMA